MYVCMKIFLQLLLSGEHPLMVSTVFIQEKKDLTRKVKRVKLSKCIAVDIVMP